MGVVDDLGPIGNPVRFFFCSPEMPEGFEITVIYSHLDLSRHEEVVFQVIAYTG
jgi:hypothetical protein